MSHIHIYRPERWQGRAVRYCTTCRRRRRFIVRLYEYHPGEWICGGCGYQFTSGEGRNHAGAKERLRMREWVKDKWPTCGRLNAVVRRMCDAIHSPDEPEDE